MRNWIERQMMKYLRKRGWIVFWIDEHCKKECTGTNFTQTCWLRIYLESEKAQR